MYFRISVGGERFEYHADIKNNFPGHSHENLRKVVYITNGGESGIRTRGEVAPTTIFETVAFDRSAISPLVRSYNITFNKAEGKGKNEKFFLFIRICLDFQLFL